MMANEIKISREDIYNNKTGKLLLAPIIISGILGGDKYYIELESFGKELRDLFSEIVDPNIPFSQCEDVDTCTYCPFKSTICNR